MVSGFGPRVGSSKSPPEPRPQVAGRTLGLSRAGGCPIIEVGAGPDRRGNGGEVSRLKVPDDTSPRPPYPGGLQSRRAACPEQRQRALEADAMATSFRASGNFRAVGTRWDAKLNPPLP